MRRSHGNCWSSLNGSGRRRIGSLPAQSGADELAMHKHLNSLRHACRKTTPSLHLAQIVLADRTPQQRQRQQIRRGNRILNGKVDANASDRRHGVGTVPNAEQSWLRPLPQAIDGDRQQLHRIPICNFLRSRRQKWRDLRQVLPKRRQALAAERPRNFPWESRTRTANTRRDRASPESFLRENAPELWFGSEGCRETRIHNTSMGAPRSSNLKSRRWSGR